MLQCLNAFYERRLPFVVVHSHSEARRCPLAEMHSYSTRANNVLSFAVSVWCVLCAMATASGESQPVARSHPSDA